MRTTIADALERVGRRVLEMLGASNADLDDLKLAFSEQDVGQVTTKEPLLLLGLFTAADVERGLRISGIDKVFEERGAGPLRVEASAADGRLMLYGASEARPLVEMRLRRWLRPAEDGAPPLDLLMMDWLTVRAPGPLPADFRPLPGQSAPGLGVSRRVLTVLTAAADRLGADGLAGTPWHYHNAVHYHKAFVFLSPAHEGRFLALCRDLEGLPLAEAAWAVDEGRVRDAESGARLTWEGAPMVRPLSARLKEYLGSQAYREAAAQAMQAHAYVVVPREGA